MNKKEVNALLHAMYAALLNSAGRYKELKSEITGALNNPSFGAAINLLDEETVSTLAQVHKGKNVEVKGIGFALKSLFTEHPEFFSESILGLLKDFSMFFRTGSQTSYNRIQKASGNSIFEPWVRTAFAYKVKKQSSVADELSKFVRDVAGNDSTELTRDQVDELRSTDLELYKEYQKLRKAFNDSWKAEASNFVRSSGEPLVPMQDLLEHLDSLGLSYQIPAGFTGLVNADLEWFAKDGERLAGVPSFATYDRVEMNPNPAPGENVLIAIPREGTPSQPKYVYKASDLASRRAKKFEAVRDLAPKIKESRTKWLKGVKTFDIHDAKTVAALVIELSYQFSSRIGSVGNATKGQSTFGLSTVEMRHLKMQSNGFTLQYPGKDGVATAHKFVAKDSLGKHILICMQELTEGKGPTDRVFTVTQKNGAVKGLNPSTVNDLFKQVVGNPNITIHKIRTLKATVLFSDQVDEFLSKHKGTLTQKQATDLTKTFATNVGKELNHVRTSGDGEAKVTPLTALNAYIDISAQTRLFDHYGLPYPQFILRALGKHRLEARLRLLTAAKGEPDAEAPTTEPTEEEPPPEEDPSAKDEPIPVLEPSEESDPSGDTPMDTPEVRTVDSPPSGESDAGGSGDAGVEEPVSEPKEPKEPPAEDPPAEPPKEPEKPSNSADIALLTIDPEADLLNEILSDPSVADDM